MHTIEKPVANPILVFRDEFDDWSILFDPDTGASYGLNPVGAFVWKHLDGTNTPADIHKKLLTNCDDAPANAAEDIAAFISELINKGYAGTKFTA